MSPKYRMNHVVLTAALIGLATVVGSAVAVVGTARPTAVAVVNVQEVFESLEEKTQVETTMKAQLDSLNEQEQDRKKELQALQADLEILAPGTPAFTEKQHELERKSIELQAWRGFQTQKLQRERGIQIEMLYRKVIDSIGQVAEQNQYDIVMFKESAVNFQGAKPEALTALIQVRKVLWAADDLDLTNNVIQMMNNEFSNRSQ